MVYLDETSSTNDEAKKMADEGAAEGTVIIAGSQSAGRGRLGREWFSPRGGVWMSVILRPPSIRPLQKLTLLAGLSVAKSLRTLYAIDAVLKWPNDVLVGERKICGILAEGTFQGETPLFVVVGIGINANTDPDSLPRGLKTEATSVRKLVRQNVSIDDLIAGILKTMDTHYDLFLRGEDKELWSEYEGLCTTIGSDVRLECEGATYEGTGRGISPGGGLILRTRNAKEITILSGDCIHLATKTRKNIKGKVKKLPH